MTGPERVERATSDYLAVSRGRHLYGTASEWEWAEELAWVRLMDEVEAVDAERPVGPPLVPAGEPCATCWGQGKVWHEADNGEGLMPRRCDGCAGAGLR